MARSKKPPVGRLHRSLRLQHRAHTGKLLHHKHTSFHGLAIIVVVAGAFMIGLGLMARATADTITVYASNPAPIPTGSAIITNPADDTVVHKSTVPVSGTCPTMSPPGVVVLLDNGVQVGSAACTNDLTFSLQIVIAPGQHRLVARIYTITGDAGPDSPPVDIVYFPPSAVTSTAQAAAEAEAQSGSPLVVTIDEPFIIFSPEKDAVWSGTITGGRLPYHVHINWGDGSSSDYTVTRSGHQQFSHHYRSMEPHRIVMRVLDADGRGITQDYAAITQYRPPVSINNAAPATPHLPFQGSLPIALYGIYLILIAGITYLWIRSHPRFAYAQVPVGRANPRGLVVARKHRKKDHH